MRILLLLPLLCVGVTALKRIIHRIEEPRSWFEAQTYCRQHHTDLLTIRDEAENNEITQDGWIGLYREPYSAICRWSDGSTDSNFCIWHTGKPELYQFCGFKQAGDTGWHSEFCDNFLPFYCVDEPLNLVQENKTWEEALEHCRHLTDKDPTIYKNHRYDLASPLTPEDYVYTQDIFEDGFNKVWIGLRYLGDQWSWNNGQNYADYLTDCPSFCRCGTLEKNVTLNIKRRDCSTKLFFVCSRESDML